MSVRAVGSLLGLLLAGLSPRAQAHGAAPIAVDVHFVERGGAKEPVLETTFGLVQRTAKGEWRLTCEETISPGIKWFSVEPDGTFGMGHTSGYARTDDGCHFQPATGVPSGVRQLERVQPAQSGPPVVALVLDVYEPGKNLVRSTDGGRAFALVAVPEGLLVNAVKADAQVPGRLLATAQDREGKYWLLDSPDLGTTWTSRQLAFDKGITKIIAAATSGLFLRRTSSGQNELWRSTDGGQTFELVLQPKTSLIFVNEIAPDDMWASAGLGEVYRSHDGGTTWAKQANAGDMMCLRSDGTQLYACVVDPATNTALVKSTDGGSTWQPVYRFDETAGMAECPADSQVGQVCNDVWLLVSVALKVPQKPVPPKPVPSTDDGGCASVGASAWSLLALGLARQRSRTRAATRSMGPSRSTRDGLQA